MPSTYSNYVKILGCVASVGTITSKPFDAEHWIPAPPGMITSELETWKLGNWGCTKMYMPGSERNTLVFNEANNAMELRFLSNGGAPIGLYNTLAGMFPDCLIEYEYFELSGSCAGYGMALIGGEPNHFVLTDAASLQGAKDAKVWTLSNYFI
jgi:hypothetical protein